MDGLRVCLVLIIPSLSKIPAKYLGNSPQLLMYELISGEK